MASLFHRAMVYLGLVDDDYDDYEPYEEPQPAPPRAGPARQYAQEGGVETGTTSSIRTIPREPAADYAGVSGVSNVRPAPVRPIQPVHNAKPYVDLRRLFRYRELWTLAQQKLAHGPATTLEIARYVMEQERSRAEDL